VSGSLVLAIDTTSEHGSIALADEGRVLEQVALHSADGFAHMLFGEIEQLLGRHNVKITDIEDSRPQPDPERLPASASV